MRVKLFEQYILNEYLSFNSHEVKKFSQVLKEHPELSVLPIAMSPGKQPISKIYRTVRQGDFFSDIYGTHDKWQEITLHATYVTDKKPKLPRPDFMKILNVEAGESDQPGWEHTTDWTIDPGYYYQVHDEVIRVCLDFNKVKKLVGYDNILNLLHDGEAEIRLRSEIPLLETIHSVEILGDFFEEDIEGEYGIDKAIKTWYPKELMPYLKLVDDFPFHTPKYCKDLEEYYKKVYKPYGVTPIKPFGNTWIDQTK